MRFETTTNPPADKQDEGGNKKGQNFHEQIQQMIEKGFSLEQIHSAIDGHPDIHSKDHFKEYAEAIHKPYSDHLSSAKDKKFIDGLKKEKKPDKKVVPKKPEK